jgi:hypothetical protein
VAQDHGCYTEHEKQAANTTSASAISLSAWLCYLISRPGPLQISQAPTHSLDLGLEVRVRSFPQLHKFRQILRGAVRIAALYVKRRESAKDVCAPDRVRHHPERVPDG